MLKKTRKPSKQTRVPIILHGVVEYLYRNCKGDRAIVTWLQEIFHGYSIRSMQKLCKEYQFKLTREQGRFMHSLV
jgi:hypothetical protein